MNKNDNYSEAMAKLASKIKKEPNSTPLQELRPVQPVVAMAPKLSVPASKEQKEDLPKKVRVNFDADEKLMERVWIFSIQKKMTLKQIAVIALSEYLDRNQAT